MSMLNKHQSKQHLSGFNTNPEGRGSVRCLITSTLEILPTHIVTLPLASLCLFCNSCFELLIISNQTSIKYSGATINTSKVHIKMYYFQQAAFLFHLTEKRGLSVILPMWYDLHVTSDSKSTESKDPSTWSFFMRFIPI